jgi:hypothetical protein
MYPPFLKSIETSLRMVDWSTACIGRQIALQELRMVVASIAMSFDVKLAPGFDYKDFNDHIFDRFLIELHRPLPIILTKRTGVNHDIVAEI